MGDCVPVEASELLDFWFADARDDEAAMRARTETWFRMSEAFDDECRARYADRLEQASRGELDDWAGTARGRLALIILLDQLSRNIHRRRAEAFAGDARAVALCREGMQLGMDRELAPVERQFFYIPLQHAEDLESQDLGIDAFTRLAQDADASLRDHYARSVKFTHEHRDVISRFGRFPHRNEVLGRESTPQEREYLGAGAARYGQ